jgi:hypothetical protein
MIGHRLLDNYIVLGDFTSRWMLTAFTRMACSTRHPLAPQKKAIIPSTAFCQNTMTPNRNPIAWSFQPQLSIGPVLEILHNMHSVCIAHQVTEAPHQKTSLEGLHVLHDIEHTEWIFPMGFLMVFPGMDGNGGEAVLSLSYTTNSGCQRGFWQIHRRAIGFSVEAIGSCMPEGSG